ncbi:MAG: Ig domain-containing protein [Flavobacterium sp.]|nr:Ig domain-containing protein [Flavobacterium sp.]
MGKKITLFAFLSFLVFSCTTDREISSNTIPVDPTSVLIHYWNFNSITGTQTLVNPDLTLLPLGGASIDYSGSGAGYMDAFTPGYDSNLQNSEVPGSGLRTRNPSDSRYLVMAVPTTGYKTIVVQFATAASSSGAQIQNYSYTVDGANYSTDGLNTTTFNTTVDPIISLVSLDFSSITEVNNNPNFKIKISFSGSNASGTTGNNRFDNVTVKGIPLSLTAPPNNLSYTVPTSFTINTPIIDLSPSVSGNVTNYSVAPALPAGLVLNTTTGIISGSPTVVSPSTNYTITASNNYGTSTTILSITVSIAPLYLLHYWNFNNLAAGTLTSVNADSSLLATNMANITYVGTGAGYMDQYASTATLNAQNGDISGLGLRFRNPCDTRNVIITAPTTGYKNVVMKFATAKSSASGASIQNYSYSLDGVNFITTGLATTTFNPNIDPTYDVVALDFSAIIGANNNPNFVVKINFGGPEASGISGNNRIDNVTFQANHI